MDKTIYTNEEIEQEFSIRYKKSIKFIHRILRMRLTDNEWVLTFKGCLVCTGGFENITAMKVSAMEGMEQVVELPVVRKRYGKVKFFFSVPTITLRFPTEQIAATETKINNTLHLVITIENHEVPFIFQKKFRDPEKNPQYYFVPMKARFKDGMALQIRRVKNGAISLVRRPMDEYESTAQYRKYENGFRSASFYYLGKVIKKLSRKRVNLFYEKEAGKAEEAAYELYQYIQENYSNGSSNYFIIDEHSSDYERIASDPGVVKKYSPKYYWLMYRANAYIATEAPAHLNILRSNNKWLRRANIDNTFVFLQHGITYLKSHSKTSTFVKGQEGAVDYVVVSSDKEANIVAEMFDIDMKKVFNTGMALFGKVVYNAIDQQNRDLVTIMLTWKPYEEHITDFTKTGYYREIEALYQQLLRYVKPENLVIVAHPKVAEAAQNTPMSANMWHGKIFDLMSQTKLLITDYSSVCYQSFYQGAGVIFYQYDVEFFEQKVGPLIPSDSEYIGPRVYNMEELKILLDQLIIDGEIQLDRIRTKQYIDNYKTINEWSDGRNLERIGKELEKNDII